MTDTKLNQVDWQFAQIDPSPNFDADKNRRVIQETIEENDRLRARRQREFGTNLRAKSEAVSQYLVDLANNKTSSTPEKYFGSYELARLRGEEIVNAIKARISEVKKQQIVNKAKKAKVYS